MRPVVAMLNPQLVPARSLAEGAQVLVATNKGPRVLGIERIEVDGKGLVFSFTGVAGTFPTDPAVEFLMVTQHPVDPSPNGHETPDPDPDPDLHT